MSLLVPDRKEIIDIIEEYSDMILRLAFTYMKNLSDAEDITQDVFIKLLEKSPAFKSDEHRKAWLIRVTINLSKNRLTSVWFTRTGPIEDRSLVFDQEEKYVLEAVLDLPLKYRRVIFLYYYEGYSIKEVANILNIKEATISSQLQRGRQQLRLKLKEDFDYE